MLGTEAGLIGVDSKLSLAGVSGSGAALLQGRA